MGRYIRTYFDKDNLLVKNSTVNYGNAKLVELYYDHIGIGCSTNNNYSRYIFHFEIDRLKKEYANCTLDLLKTSHKIHIRPTYTFEDGENKAFVSTTTICLFPLNQIFDEGCGGSPDGCNTIGQKNKAVQDASNWIMADSLLEWETKGVFDSVTGDSLYLECKNITCKSNCDWLSYDVTDIVNTMITGTTENYGFGIAYHNVFESFNNNTANYIGIHTRNTDTFFEPFLETKCDNSIQDDRNDFTLGGTNKLYLNTNNQILDENPIVKIYNEEDVLLYETTGSCCGLGFYSAEISLENTDLCGNYYDRWEGIKIGGKEYPYAENVFEIKTAHQFSFDSENVFAEILFDFKFHGINHCEMIQSGDVRRLFVDIYEKYSPTNKVCTDSLKWRLYKKEGCDELTIIDYCEMNKLNCKNWIDIDTSWMIKGDYYIGLQANYNGVVRTYQREIMFTVLNENCC